MTAAELALRWGMDAGTLANWRAADPRQGPRFFHAGRNVRYRMRDVLAYEARQVSK